MQKKMGVMMSQWTEAVKATVFLFVVLGVSATNHSVGGPSGWDLSSNVEAWSATNNFHVGDSLVYKRARIEKINPRNQTCEVFTYSRVHCVLEVNQLEYNTCLTINPISFHNSGNTVVQLTQPGTRYFICGRKDDCDKGLKVRVTVFPQLTANETIDGVTGGFLPKPPRRPRPSGPQSPSYTPPSPIHRPSRPPPSIPDLDFPLPLPPPVMVFPPPVTATMSPPPGASPSNSGVGGCLDSLFPTLLGFAINYLLFSVVGLF